VFNDAAQPVVLRREAHSAALTTGALPAQSLQSRFVVPLADNAQRSRIRTARRGGTLTDEHHRPLAEWAAVCAEHVLNFFDEEEPRVTRPRDAIDVGRAWVRGEVRMGDARGAAFAANAARGLPDPAKFAALVAGQAAAVAHVVAHDLGAAAYAIRAVGAAASAGETGTARIRKRDWQRERLPAEVRELVLDDQRSRSPICWSVVGEARHPSGDYLRRLRRALAD
jgi:hypothetical protein